MNNKCQQYDTSKEGDDDVRFVALRIVQHEVFRRKHAWKVKPQAGLSHVVVSQMNHLPRLYLLKCACKRFLTGRKAEDKGTQIHPK